VSGPDLAQAAALFAAGAAVWLLHDATIRRARHASGGVTCFEQAATPLKRRLHFLRDKNDTVSLHKLMPARPCAALLLCLNKLSLGQLALCLLLLFTQVLLTMR
jgi:hypothetical protein